MKGLTREEQEGLARAVEGLIRDYERQRDRSSNPDEAAELDKEIVNLRRGLERHRAQKWRH